MVFVEPGNKNESPRIALNGAMTADARNLRYFLLVLELLYGALKPASYSQHCDFSIARTSSVGASSESSDLSSADAVSHHCNSAPLLIWLFCSLLYWRISSRQDKTIFCI